jgi:hypothetical protein
MSNAHDREDLISSCTSLTTKGCFHSFIQPRVIAKPHRLIRRDPRTIDNTACPPTHMDSPPIATSLSLSHAASPSNSTSDLIPRSTPTMHSTSHHATRDDEGAPMAISGSHTGGSCPSTLPALSPQSTDQTRVLDVEFLAAGHAQHASPSPSPSPSLKPNVPEASYPHGSGSGSGPSLDEKHSRPSPQPMNTPLRKPCPNRMTPTARKFAPPPWKQRVGWAGYLAESVPTCNIVPTLVLQAFSAG